MNNSLTDIAGLLVGHYTDPQAVTGCTIVLCPEGAVAGVDVRGAAPGTRETDLLQPMNLVQQVHGILLTGGSAFGLDAASGVMQWLEEQGIGFHVGVGVVPIVPAAVLFDLGIGQADVRPGAEEGYLACQQATAEQTAFGHEIDPNQVLTEGSVGAGTGATVGKLFGMLRATKSGLGMASRQLANEVKVGAMVAVNAFGDIIDPQNNQVLAGVRTSDGTTYERTMDYFFSDLSETMFDFAQNTTLAVVATDATLTKSEATKMAQMAHDGLARTINPVHTMFDGDTVFALATGKNQRPTDISVIGAVATSVLAEAVIRSVQQATSLGGLPSWREIAR